MEEERDFLLQEKDALDERLQNLEVRQQAFQEREKNAGHQGKTSLHVLGGKHGMFETPKDSRSMMLLLPLSLLLLLSLLLFSR